MKRALVHDGGKLLIWMMRKLSIPRELWQPVYIYWGDPKPKFDKDGDYISGIPTKVYQRKVFLSEHVEKVIKSVTIDGEENEIIGMGKLACEIMTGATRIKMKAGTCWKPRQEWCRNGIRRVWITYSPDAVLFNPDMVVSMLRVLGKAARKADIEIKLNDDINLFDWSKYQ